APFANRVADSDATVYRKLRDAGAVLLGKLSMIELAGGLGYHWANAAFNGACVTPWDLTRWAGGSSSGAGSAVAAGLVGFAIGSETWGSIVCPSAFCGVTGLRPTYGLVSRAGTMALSWSFDKLGPICRTAFDTALVLNVIAGRDPLDPGSVEAPRDTGAVGAAGAAGARLKRFVVPADQKYDRDALDPIFDAATEVFRAGNATIDALNVPPLPLEPAAIAILTADVQAAFANVLASGQARQLADKSHQEGKTMADSPAVSGALYVKALQVRRMAQAAADEIFAGCDAILTPNFYAPAPLVEKNIDEQLPWNDPLGALGALAGLPALAFPAGFVGANPATKEKGLPISMILIGKPFSEAKLVSLAAYFQQRTRFHLERPPHA
ncbi:MAG TPA: amidase, partial [bacterium]|nr:amidase [bacterium]